MVHYKLIYFNLRGRAELARLVLQHQEIVFEDFRFEREEWPKYKAGINIFNFNHKEWREFHLSAVHDINRYALRSGSRFGGGR